MTGSVVLAAMAPAKWAAMPAAATITPKPFSRALRAKSRAWSGVRWAEKTWASKGTSKALRVSTAFWATGRSLSLPMTMATFFMSVSSPKKK